jgi:hypothetical protein
VRNSFRLCLLGLACLGLMVPLGLEAEAQASGAELRRALAAQEIEPLACPLPSRPAAARGRGSTASRIALSVGRLGHRVVIPAGAIREADGDVQFEVAHPWEPSPESQILMVTAHRITPDGERTGYRFDRPVRVRISWARCGVAPERVRVYKTSDGGATWRQILERVPRRGQRFVEFEDDAFSGYVVAG